MAALQNIIANMTSYQDNITTLHADSMTSESANTSLESSIKTLTDQMRVLTTKVHTLEINGSSESETSIQGNQDNLTQSARNTVTPVCDS